VARPTTAVTMNTSTAPTVRTRMRIGRLLSHSPLPDGSWLQCTRWHISSIEGAYAARATARDLVAGEVGADAGRPMLSSAPSRVEHVMGELAVNAVRHGAPPVQASLSRSGTGWLIVVSDTATEPFPAVNGPETLATTGGLGIRLVLLIATTSGWYGDDSSKHIWALVGDEPPAHLIDACRSAGG
jgi:hypothetical protein